MRRCRHKWDQTDNDPRLMWCIQGFTCMKCGDEKTKKVPINPGAWLLFSLIPISWLIGLTAIVLVLTKHIV